MESWHAAEHYICYHCRIEEAAAKTEVQAERPPALTRKSPSKFLRSKGIATPGLLAASLLDSALLAFASVRLSSLHSHFQAGFMPEKDG